MATEREKDRQSEIKREEEREIFDENVDEEKLRAPLFDAFDATDS